MKLKRTTVIIALVVALVIVTTVGAYAGVAHRRAIARSKVQAPAPTGSAVATTQPAPGTAGTDASAITAVPDSSAPTPVLPAGATPPSAGKPPAAPPGSVRPGPVSRGTVDRKPLAGRVIFVDAGHGISGSGANGANGGDEAANNLATALILRDMLADAGARVVMTRTTMISPVVPGVTDDQLEARTTMANRSGADIFVSLHENYNDSNSDARGLTVYYRSDAASINLAKRIDFTTAAATGWYDWGTAFGDYYVLRNSRLKAAVLVECGFLSNATDERILGTDAFRQKIAQGVFNGIVAYFQ